MEKSAAAKYFEENNYVKITNFIKPEEASFLYDYIKLAAYRCAYIENSMVDFNEEIFGTFNDEQAPGDYSRYGDLTFDTLLARKLPEMEFLTGKKLIPNYSYHRLYTTNTELVRHKDRPSCEISTTLCLGYDNSNLKDKKDKWQDYDWPMWVDKSGSFGKKGIPIHMKPGDMIIYRGCLVEHWREPFLGNNHAQVFLHYNNADGPYKDNCLFDGRPHLGLPPVFKDPRKMQAMTDADRILLENQAKEKSKKSKSKKIKSKKK